MMDESESTSSSSSFGFNKRRAEGMDKSHRPKKNLQLKSRTLNPTNTIAYVQILGTGMDTQDTSPSVLLFFDKQRFIFNAGEGLQRFCTEHKIKLSKIDHVFLSRVCSETAGGLPGLLLTLAGTGEEGISVNVWGPSDLVYLVDAMKSFIPHAAMVHTRSFGPASGPPDPSKFADPFVLVNDEVVKLSALFICPNHSEGLPVRPGDMSVLYICELPELMGKFDPKKAAALGLKAGPKYAELQKGKSVKSDSLDIMVHPSDVMGSSIPGPIVLLVDCPTESHLDKLLSIESLREYYSDLSGNQTSSKSVNCVIHLSPASVVNNPNYRKWMRKFGRVLHIFAGHEMKNMEVPILKGSARLAARLNYVCPQFFPFPGFWSLNHQPSYTTSDANATSNGIDSELGESISAKNLLKFTLRPYAQLGLDRSHIPSLMTHSETISELLSEVPEIVDAAHNVRQFWHELKETNGLRSLENNNEVIEEPWLDNNTLPSVEDIRVSTKSEISSTPRCLDNIRRDDLEIVLLGTGSSQPSKYRNVSSVYINLFCKGSLLLDCGEGTLGQLKRRYGVDGANDAIRTLKCIWISHIHADHHTGLARVFALRRDLLKGVPHEPLLVIGPWQLKRFLDAYQRLEDLDMQFLDCRNTTKTSWDSFERDLKLDKDEPCSESSQNNNTSLFSRGTQMQSILKRPGTPVDKSSFYPILRNLKELLAEAGLEALISFPVVHCPQSFGISLKAAERVNSVGKMIPGWQIVYSGDTRPCPELVEASRGATVLIHEATFEDALVEEAIAKNHSTTEEAIEMGDAAGVYRIILTHFSQRYPKIPVFDERHMHKTCVAFDMMSINIADLSVLPKVLPYLKLLFRDEMAVDEPEDALVSLAEASLMT